MNFLISLFPINAMRQMPLHRHYSSRLRLCRPVVVRTAHSCAGNCGFFCSVTIWRGPSALFGHRWMPPRFITGEEFSAGVNMRTCIYVAGILGLAIVVTQTGIGTAVGEALLRIMPLDADRPFTSFLALTGITTALNFIMTANGVPALYTTLAQSFSDATGFPLLSVIMIQVLGYSTPLLPYQASPIVVAMGLGKVPAKAGMLLCLALAIATYLVLLPLDYLWFSVLGRL